MARIALIVVAFVSLSGTAFGQGMKVPENVTVTHSGEDRIGQRLIYQIREEIESSDQMNLVDSGSTNIGVNIHIVTIDPYEGDRQEGLSTIFSSTWTYFIGLDGQLVQVYLTSTVGNYGTDNLSRAAASIAATTDEQRRKVPTKVRDMFGVVNKIREMGESR